jgi:isopenicillin N synthase-like dioxygenase
VQAIDLFRPVKDEGPPYETGRGQNKWPSTPSDFRAVSELYVVSIVALGASVMRALALVLDVDEKIFTERIDKAFWNLRVVAYPGIVPGGEEVSGIGEHTGTTAAALSHEIAH